MIGLTISSLNNYNVITNHLVDADCNICHYRMASKWKLHHKYINEDTYLPLTYPLGSVVELVVKLITCLELMTFLLPNHIIS